jgi:hypothetical protein
MTITFQECDLGEKHASVKEAWRLLNLWETKTENSPEPPKDTVTDAFSKRLKEYQRVQGLVRSAIHDRGTWLALRGEDYVCDYRRWATRRSQTSKGNCWRACTAMLYNCMEHQIPQDTFQTGSDGGLDLSGSNLDAFAKAQGLTRVPFHDSAHGFAHAFWNKGPLMLSVSDGFFGIKSLADVHFVLCVMIRGDFSNITDNSLMVYDPWPVNQGRVSRFNCEDLLGECTNYFYRNSWSA